MNRLVLNQLYYKKKPNLFLEKFYMILQKIIFILMTSYMSNLLNEISFRRKNF